MTKNSDPTNKQEFLTLIGHSLEVLEDGPVSNTNKQSIKSGILETISKLMDQRNEATARADAAEARAEAAQKSECHWKREDFDSDTWNGECGAVWVFIDDGPVENDVHFCPSCGKKLIVVEEVSEE